jgi:hypothetical protein
MLTTGIRSEVGVKVFGSDLKVLEDRARAVAEVLRAIPGAADVYPEQGASSSEQRRGGCARAARQCRRDGSSADSLWLTLRQQPRGRWSSRWTA